MAAVGFGLRMEEDAVYGAGGGGRSPVLVGGGVTSVPSPPHLRAVLGSRCVRGRWRLVGMGLWMVGCSRERGDNNKNLRSPWTQGALSWVCGCAVLVFVCFPGCAGSETRSCIGVCTVKHRDLSVHSCFSGRTLPWVFPA